MNVYWWLMSVITIQDCLLIILRTKTDSWIVCGFFFFFYLSLIYVSTGSTVLQKKLLNRYHPFVKPTSDILMLPMLQS